MTPADNKYSQFELEYTRKVKEARGAAFNSDNLFADIIIELIFFLPIISNCILANSPAI